MIRQQLFINNKWINSSDNKWIEVLNPSTEEKIGSVAMGTKEDAKKALKSSEMAFESWKQLSAKQRGDLLRQLAKRLLEQKDEFAKLLVLEQGKLLRDAYGEVEGTAEFLVYAAESARRIEGEILESDFSNEKIMIHRVPYGVTVGLLTWNYPLALAGRKLGNALVTGNTMILMPPLYAPFTVYKLGLLAQEIFPAGVVQIVTGAGDIVGDELVKNSMTKFVSLTGSTSIGRIIAKGAAKNLTVLSLELGGKAPFIVMDDVDIEKVVKDALVSGFGNAGQICTSIERMYIHENIYETFMKRLVEEVEKLKVGDPFEAATDIGPKMNNAELEKVEAMVNKAVSEGAIILTGGQRPKHLEKGYFYEPTVIENVTNDMEIMQEEVFGPVVVGMKVSSFDEALKLANDCAYGLSGYLYTNNNKYIMEASQNLEVGEIYINRPNGEAINAFHSGTKLSGIGGEDGKHGLELYSQKKTVYINYN